ncbi:hypothetical protein [Gemmobacter sp. LW-1]|jgi:hypothetical protein|uniref:hypothetical protein n=1 Tax=Gemmobacter sp. LW-1 TaxID=1529005 RepID=UPI0006C741D4|nr:hypothetical protein [Gemmobacter sp. LW-1]
MPAPDLPMNAFRPFLVAPLALAACTAMPELAPPAAPAGPAPALQPIDTLLAEAQLDAVPVNAADGLAGRAAALQSRAAALRALRLTTPEPTPATDG